MAKITMESTINLSRIQAVLGSRSSSENPDVGEKLGYKEDHNPEAYQFTFDTQTLNLVYDPPFDDGDGFAGNGTVVLWWERKESSCDTTIVKTGIPTDGVLLWIGRLLPHIDARSGEFIKLGINTSKYKKDFDVDAVVTILGNSRKISGFSDRIARKYGFEADLLTLGSSHQFVFSHLNTRLVLGMLDKDQGENFSVWGDYYPDIKDPYCRPYHNSKYVEGNKTRGNTRRGKQVVESNFIDSISNPLPYFQCVTTVGRKVRENYAPLFQFVTASTEQS